LRMRTRSGLISHWGNGNKRMMDSRKTIQLLSLVIPARDEAGCIAETIEGLHRELSAANIKHELVVVDDGSKDRTWDILQELSGEIPELKPIKNPGLNGFGRAIRVGLKVFSGDAVVITMADASDDPKDVVRYYDALCRGVDCVFGSRFMKGAKISDYPKIKWLLNRLANRFIRILFVHGLNDTTNAFKAYRRKVIEGCRPILSPHFNITVELPLKAAIRGFSYEVIPVSWTNRKSGESKLKIREMGSRYFFIVMYLWLEKFFSRGDYHREVSEAHREKVAATESPFDTDTD